MRVAIALTLFEVKGKLQWEKYDTSSFRNEENERLEKALQMAKESIDTWEKHSGSNGYFDFIEEYMGRNITGEDMKFSIMSSCVLDM